jgi:hypothetical protein
MLTEEYDGTSWGPGGNMGYNKARALGGAGTTNSSIRFWR